MHALLYITDETINAMPYNKYSCFSLAQTLLHSLGVWIQCLSMPFLINKAISDDWCLWNRLET
jgi:hypothetical protein